MRAATLIFTAIWLFAPGENVVASPAGAGAELQKQAKSTLDVGLRSLAFLFSAGPESFLLKDALLDDGSWSKLVELEKAGYVTLNTITSGDGDFVQVFLTDAGRSLRAELLAAE